MLAASVTSSLTASTSNPLRAISSAAASPFAQSRDPSRTRIRFSASWRETSRPMPRFPPVTRAVSGAGMAVSLASQTPHKPWRRAIAWANQNQPSANGTKKLNVIASDQSPLVGEIDRDAGADGESAQRRRLRICGGRRRIRGPVAHPFVGLRVGSGVAEALFVGDERHALAGDPVENERRALARAPSGRRHRECDRFLAHAAFLFLERRPHERARRSRAPLRSPAPPRSPRAPGCTLRIDDALAEHGGEDRNVIELRQAPRPRRDRSRFWRCAD